MENVLITGVTGFVGTQMVRHFKVDPDVKLFGHSRKVLEVEGMTYLPAYGAEVLIGEKITSFIHLAGIAHDLSNQYAPEDYYRVNYEGTKKAVDEFLRSDARKFIFVSSIKAVCDVSSVPADEQMTPSPQTDYGKSKWKAEEYIRSVASQTDKQFYILRPAMIHGPGNKGNLNLLYRFAKSGLPFPFGAFHNQRSFHSIENFIFIVQSILEKEIAPGTYHLADDGFLSTPELYQLIGEALGKKAPVLNVPQGLISMGARVTGKAGMVKKLTENMRVSNQKIVRAIGSSLPVNLRDGLMRTIQSFDGK